jgi:glycosyltransferase involved in cell wall biosynthesis
MGASLNSAMKNAQGEIICRMDADDVMHPTRLQKQFEYLELHPEITVVSCLANYIDETGRILGKTFSDIITKEDCDRYFQSNEPIGLFHPGTMFRKKPIIEAGGYRGKFWPAEDIDLWNRIVEKGYFSVVLQELLMDYRIHGSSSITSSFVKSRIQYEWVRDCMWKRRKGEIEFDRDQFLKTYNDISILKLLNKKRKLYAKYFYRTSGFNFASKKFHLFLFQLILSFFLQPKYVLLKILRQIKL